MAAAPPPYPPLVPPPRVLAKDGMSCFGACAVDKVNSGGKAERRQLVITKDFVVVVDGLRVCRAFWIREMEKLVVKGDEVLMTPKPGVAEPALLVRVAPGPENNPRTGTEMANIISQCHAANTKGSETLRVEGATAHADLKKTARMAKPAGYLDPKQKLKSVQKFGLQRPSLADPVVREPSPPPIPDAVVNPTMVPLQDEPQQQRAAHHEVVEPILPPPPQPQQQQQQQPEVHQYKYVEPPIKRRDSSVGDRLPKPRHHHNHRRGSSPRLPRSRSVKKQHKVKDDFWAGFVKDYTALEEEWGATRGREQQKHYRRNSGGGNGVGSSTAPLSPELLTQLMSRPAYAAGGRRSSSPVAIAAQHHRVMVPTAGGRNDSILI